MAAITRERTSVHRWWKDRGMTIGDLASVAGLTPTTISNLLSGLSKNRRSRQQLTNAVGREIFEGIRPLGRYVFEKGCVIEVPEGSAHLAKESARENPGGAIQCEGLKITFLRTIPVFFSDPSAPRARQVTAAKQPAKKSSHEKVRA